MGISEGLSGERGDSEAPVIGADRSVMERDSLSCPFFCGKTLIIVFRSGKECG